MEKLKAYDLLMKMVFVGDSGVGKTNLLTRITEDRFHVQHLSTIGVEFNCRTYEIDGLKVKVQMWDTAGQERFKSLSAPYYRGAGAIVLCYSLNDAHSIQNLDRWLKQVQLYAEENTQTVLMGCKSDMGHSVPLDIVEQMIAEKGFKHYITSAKTGEGVDEAIRSVITDWTRRKIRQSLQIEAQNQIRVDALAQKRAIGEEGKPGKVRGCC